MELSTHTKINKGYNQIISTNLKNNIVVNRLEENNPKPVPKNGNLTETARYHIII